MKRVFSLLASAAALLAVGVSMPDAAHASTYYLTQDGSSGGSLGGNLTIPGYGYVDVTTVGSDLQFDVELAPNWNVDAGGHHAVAFALATSGLTISGLNFPYSQTTAGAPFDNPGFSGPFNYAIDCIGLGNGQNACGTTRNNGDLATSLIFTVLNGGSLSLLKEGGVYITVDIYGTVNGTTGVVGAPDVNVVPLPAALPLFATGLGVMGLFGWRRKRKAEALA